MKSQSITKFLFPVLMALSSAVMAETYEQDFEAGRAPGWQAQTRGNWKIAGTEANRFYQAGAGKSVSAEKGAYVSTFRGATYQDFDYRVRVKSDSAYPSFLLFRASADFSRNGGTGAGTGYAFGFRAQCAAGQKDKAFRIYKQVNGGLQNINDEWTFSDKLNCAAVGNRIRVTAVGGEINFYVNDSKVFTYVDPAPIARGRIGLMAFDGADAPTTHQFDNIYVTPISQCNLVQ
jgi:hypothetical protein